MDNTAGRVLSSVRLGVPKLVLIRVSRGRSRRPKVPIAYVRRFSKLAASVFETGRQGRIWKAMTLNGFLYSAIYHYSPYESLDALGAGALGAGLSGTGPAVAAVFARRKEMESLASLWEGDEVKLIKTETSDGGAQLGH